MHIVIDTNILVSALKSGNDYSRAVLLLEDVFAGIYTVCYSDAILEEYRDVLSRPHLGLDPEDVEETISMIIEFGEHIEPKPTTSDEVQMKDEDDRIFFDVAKCLNAKLITRNHKDYPVHELVTLIEELY